AKGCEFAAEVKCADAGLHADQARRNIREPFFHLATRPLLSQHDRTALIETYNVERVLTDIDADHGNRSKASQTWVLLVFGAPCQPRVLAGQEYGRTSPLQERRDSATFICARRVAANTHDRPMISAGAFIPPLVALAALSAR